MKKWLIPFLAGAVVMLLIAAQPKIGTRAVVLEVNGFATNLTATTGISIAATNLIPLNATANRIALIGSGGVLTNGVNGTGALTNDGSGGLGYYLLTGLASFGNLAWTNIPSGVPLVGDILSSVSPYRVVQIATNRIAGGGSEPFKSIFVFGQPPIDIPPIASSNRSVLIFGDRAFKNSSMTNCGSITLFGSRAAENATWTNAIEILAFGENSLTATKITNTYFVNAFGGYILDAAILTGCNYISAMGWESMGSAYASNCYQVLSVGHDAMGINFDGTHLTNITGLCVVGNNAANDIEASSSQNISIIGEYAFKLGQIHNCADIVAIGTEAGTNLVLTAKTNVYLLGNVGAITPSNNEFWFGNTANTHRMPGTVLAGRLGLTNTLYAETNTAPFDIVITDFTVNTWYTNDSRRAVVSLSFELDANATGTAKAGIYVDQAVDGTFETTKTVQTTGGTDAVQHECTAWLQPGARFAITNLSSGTGSPTVTVVVGSCQWVKQ